MFVVLGVTSYLGVQVIEGGRARDLAIAKLAATVEAVVEDVDGLDDDLDHLRRLHESR